MELKLVKVVYLAKVSVGYTSILVSWTSSAWAIRKSTEWDTEGTDQTVKMGQGPTTGLSSE